MEVNGGISPLAALEVLDYALFPRSDEVLLALTDVRMFITDAQRALERIGIEPTPDQKTCREIAREALRV